MTGERHFLIKPASGFCNMRCDYCFYADEMKERSEQSYGMMSLETSHNLIRKAFSDLTAGTITFAFQGGEPTTRGLDFFRDFASFVKKCQKGTMVSVNYAIQTNGILIDKDWADFFKEENFLVGLSMDGNGKIHDKYRHMPGGKGSFKNVFRTANLLTREGVEFNILSTVNKTVSRNAVEIYEFFKKNGFRHIQFIPCLDFIGDERGSLPWSLDAKDYGEFLVKLFPLYYRDWRNDDYMSIRYFDNLVFMLTGERPEACGMAGICGINYVVEADGTVFPCDFYVLDRYEIGNVNTDSISEMDAKRKEIGFVEKSMKVEEECKVCPYGFLCRGGCRRDREDFSTGELHKTYLCPAYKRFFSFALEGLKAIATAEMKATGRA